MRKLIEILAVILFCLLISFDGYAYNITKHGDYTQQATITIDKGMIVHALKQVIKDHELCKKMGRKEALKDFQVKTKQEAIEYTFQIIKDYGDIYVNEILAGETELNDRALAMFNKLFKTNYDQQIL